MPGLLDRVSRSPHHGPMQIDAPPRYIFKVFGAALLLAATSALVSCASVSTQLPAISAPKLKHEEGQQLKSALAQLRQSHHRLYRVSGPVLKANADLCPRTKHSLGVVTHTLETYPEKLRPAAKTELGARDHPTIYYIIPGSAAENAGLQIGDVMTFDGTTPIGPDNSELRAQTHAGHVRMTLKRGDTLIPIDMTPHTICDYDVRLNSRSSINATADGRRIRMTTGMLNFVETDDELAMIIAHELAHNTMGHVRKIVGNMILSLGRTRYTRPFESEADYVGLYYLARAGYDLNNIEDVWRRMATFNPGNVVHAKTHPTYPNRTLLLSAAREEIYAKIERGETLRPNAKSSRPENAN